MQVGILLVGGMLLLITAILSERLSGKWKVICWLLFVVLLCSYVYMGIRLEMSRDKEKYDLEVAHAKEKKEADVNFDTVLGIARELLTYAKSPEDKKDISQLQAIGQKLDDLKKQSSFPSTGNLKERAINLASRIKQFLYNYGYPQRSPLTDQEKETRLDIQSLPSDPNFIKKFPWTSETWMKEVSWIFESMYLAQVYAISFESSQLHFRDQDFDDSFNSLKSVQNKKKRSPEAIVYYLPQQIESIAEGLEKLADKIPSMTAIFNNKQICANTTNLVKRLQAFDYQYARSFGELFGSPIAKRNEKEEHSQEYTAKFFELSSRLTNEYRTNLLGEAVYLRDELLRRLSPQPQPDNPFLKSDFEGRLAGPHPAGEVADYLESLSRKLCPQ